MYKYTTQKKPNYGSNSFVRIPAASLGVVSTVILILIYCFPWEAGIKDEDIVVFPVSIASYANNSLGQR